MVLTLLSSLKFYTILVAYSDKIQAVSIDEALLDVSSRVMRLQSTAAEKEGAETDWAKAVAETIRDDVRAATGCESE